VTQSAQRRNWTFSSIPNEFIRTLNFIRISLGFVRIFCTQQADLVINGLSSVVRVVLIDNAAAL
jgi:hypothetical protein